MTALDVVRRAYEIGATATLGLIDDMRDAALTQPTPRGGNHALWVLGHLTYVEGSIPKTIFGEPNPVAHWAPLFAPGSEPKTDASAYPPFDEVRRKFDELHAANLKILEKLGESGLDRPTASPPRGLEKILCTVGDTFMVIGLHHMSHRGQIADARRAIGRKPVFTPSM